MSEVVRKKLMATIQRIQDQRPIIQPAIDSLRSEMAKFPAMEMEESEASYWRLQILSDALIKLRLFTENNFRVIETMGVLALTRYVFEIVVILKQLRANDKYAFLYMQKMFKQQLEHFEKYATHIQSEIAYYKARGEEEAAAHDAVIENYAISKSPTRSSRNSKRLSKKVISEIKNASSFIDEGLELRFALYSDEVAHNGYAIQAHMLESQVLVSVVKNAELAKASYESVRASWKDYVEPFPKCIRNWDWKEMSKIVGMEEEYDFIYSYTSKLLHATPHSLTTDQKNLEDSEVLIFLRYVEQQISWIMGYADEVLGRRMIH